jgi:predicted nicotinamide N-methyase
MPRTVEEDHRMGQLHQCVVAGLAMSGTADSGLDGLRQVPVPLVPEVRLHLATDAIVLWARLEAEAGTKLASPFWASAWLGGQALARTYSIIEKSWLVAG